MPLSWHRVAMRFALLRQRHPWQARNGSHYRGPGLTLVPYLEPSISQVSLPQYRVRAPLIQTPRADDRQARLPPLGRDRWGARPAAGSSRRRGTRGARSIGLLMNNETLRWGPGGGWGWAGLGWSPWMVPELRWGFIGCRGLIRVVGGAVVPPPSCKRGRVGCFPERCWC